MFFLRLSPQTLQLLVRSFVPLRSDTATRNHGPECHASGISRKSHFRAVRSAFGGVRPSDDEPGLYFVASSHRRRELREIGLEAKRISGLARQYVKSQKK